MQRLHLHCRQLRYLGVPGNRTPARPAKSYSPATFPPDVFSLPHLQSLFFFDDVARADELVRIRLHGAGAAAVGDGVRMRAVDDSTVPLCLPAVVSAVLCLELVASRECVLLLNTVAHGKRDTVEKA
jgi:hypothetical protein